jgi:Asp-tRNA(Asn)/Glu-tRNA(Gln) amidotransferase A subunit family amidase
MSKKWYNYFVSVDPAEAAAAAETSDAPAARTVADIAASVAPVTNFTAPVSNPGSFEEIYHAAEINAPSHGYTILKIAEMLQSERIRGLPAEVKKNSVLLALEAAGVQIDQVIQDAVRRDRALDTYERVLEKSATDLENSKTEENRKLEAEMEKMMAEYRSRIQANTDEIAKEKDRFYGWRLQKQQEEKKIADAVSYFVSDNPITVGGAAAAPPPKTGA